MRGAIVDTVSRTCKQKLPLNRLYLANFGIAFCGVCFGAVPPLQNSTCHHANKIAKTENALPRHRHHNYTLIGGSTIALLALPASNASTAIANAVLTASSLDDAPRSRKT